METKTPETEYNAATHVAEINKHQRREKLWTALIAGAAAGLIGAVVGIGAYALTPRASLDDLTVDDVCALVLSHGGVPADCTTMYRLEPIADMKPKG